jgi:hypothetical protein
MRAAETDNSGTKKINQNMLKDISGAAYNEVTSVKNATIKKDKKSRVTLQSYQHDILLI